MELPEQDFSDMNNVDLTIFEKLLRAVCKALLASASSVGDKQLNALQSEFTAYDLKKMSGQLFSFISEVCRSDATNQTIISTLDDYQLEKGHRDKLGSAIAHYKMKIRDKFAQTSVPISQLLGIECRLCQDIKQKQMSRINKPSYLIKYKFNVCIFVLCHFLYLFHVASIYKQDGEKVFECSYEQLQDLVGRLKVARNSALRLLSQ